MSFSSGGGSGSIATSSDVALSSASNGQALVYNSSLGKWQNQAQSGVQGAPGLVWRGAYDNGTTYGVNDAVLYSDGNAYLCSQGTTGIAPPNATYWSLLTKGAASTLSAVSTGEETMPRTLVSQSVALVSGVLRLTYFSALKSETITRVTVATGTTAASGSSGAKYGIYSVDLSGNLTLVASSASNTSLWTTASQPTAGTNVTQAITSWNKVAGQRYAVGLLFIGSTPPTILGAAPMMGDAVSNAVDPRLCAQVTGQTDLPSTVSAGSLGNVGTTLYVALLP